MSNLRWPSKIWGHCPKFEVRKFSWVPFINNYFLLIPEPIIADISDFGLQSWRFLWRLTSIKISNSALFEFSFIKSNGKSDVDSNEFPGFFEDLVIKINFRFFFEIRGNFFFKIRKIFFQNSKIFFSKFKKSFLSKFCKSFLSLHGKHYDSEIFFICSRYSRVIFFDQR